MSSDKFNIDLKQEFLKDAIVHQNVQQSIIVITEDKAKLILLERLVEIEDRKSWIAPAGILLSLGAIPLTSNFKDAFFMAQTWESIFYMVIILDTFWLIKCIYKAVKAVFFKKTTVESIIDNMKKYENTQHKI